MSRSTQSIDMLQDELVLLDTRNRVLHDTNDRLRALLREALPNLADYVVMAADQPKSLWSRIHKEAAVEGFHSHDGWYWKRQEDGSVRVSFHGNPPDPEAVVEHIVDASSWASIVASVSAQGETGETFRRALAFHDVGPLGG